MAAAPLYDSLIGALDSNDLDALEKLAMEGRLELLDGPVEDLFPGLSIRTAWDTHTQGGQYVVVSDHHGQRWVVTGDAMYSYENAEGINQSGEFVNIGFGGGSGWAGLRLIREMVNIAEDTNRLVIVHESETFNRFPSKRHADSLSVAELLLAPGVTSRLEL
jgi:N-acyl homoserine lactone hydrolase